MRLRRAGFTLVELLVVIAIIGTLVALLLPAVQAARETARGNTCRNNIKQLMTALMNMDTTQRKLPGYVNALKDPTDQTGAKGRRASWIVMVFPYMEQTALWDQWSSDFTTDPTDAAAPYIEGLVCPSDTPDIVGQPSLSYIGNSGQAFSDPDREDDREHAANGVFFDNSRSPDILTGGSAEDGREGDPAIQVTMDYIQSNDGTSKTLLISENVHTWYYAYDGDDSTEFYEVGFDKWQDTSDIKDTKHIYGFVWKIDPEGIERINGDKYHLASDPPGTMVDFAVAGTGTPSLYESYGYPSSNHPGVVNVAFCGGQVEAIADQIEPRIYAMLMTSNRNRSTYEYGGTSDRRLTQPSDADY